MTDSKSKEKRDKLDADLDSMLNEVQFPQSPTDEFQDEEDAIDRLLKNAGFDSDHDVGDDNEPDLPDLSSLDDLKDEFNESELNRQFSSQIAGSKDESSDQAKNQIQDDEDALDRLPMTVGFDDEKEHSITQDESKHEETEDFLELDNQSEILPVSDPAENSSVEEAELDDYLGLVNDIDELDVIEDDQSVEPVPALVDLIVPEEPTDSEDDLSHFTDFSDFTEQDTEDTAAVIVESDELDKPGSDQIEESASTIASSLIEETNAVSELDYISDITESKEVVQDSTEMPEVAVDGSEQTFLADETELSEKEIGFSGFGDDVGMVDISQGVSDETMANLIDEDLVEQTSQTKAEFVADDGNDDFLKQIEDQIAEAENLSQNKQEVDFITADEGNDDFLKQIEDQIAEAESLSQIKQEEDFITADEGNDDFLKQIEDQIAEAESLSQNKQEEDFITADEGNDDFLKQIENQIAEAENLSQNKQDDFIADDDIYKLDEISDDFSRKIEDQLAEAENLSKSPDKQEDDFLLPDFDISAGFEDASNASDTVTKEDELDVFFGDTGFLNQEDAIQVAEPDGSGFDEAVIEPMPIPVKGTEAVEEVTSVTSSPSESGSEGFKKQLEAAQNAVKKTRLLVYIALGFAGVAVSAAVGLGIVTYGAKTEVSKLTGTVSTLEASLAKIAENNPDKEINTMVHSVAALNQQVYGLISELKGNAQLPADLLDNKIADLVAKQDLVSKALSMLQVKMGDALDKVTIEPLVLETHKPELTQVPPTLAPTPVKEIAPVKTDETHAPAKEAVDHLSAKKEAIKEIGLNNDKAKPEPVPAKVDEKSEAAPVKTETKPEKPAAKVVVAPTPTPTKIKTQPEPVIAKPVAPVKQEPENAKSQQTSGKWGVNLVAFKQEWFAKSKAAEFARQGVYAEVMPVTDNNNSTLYRLRVGGFKNKAEATASKDKIKKILNLDSVWVSDN
jgi:cell division septation protein DedD